MARVTVWQPFGEMIALNEAMGQLAHNRLRGTHGGRSVQAMAVDLAENSEGYKLTAVLPGVNPDHLTIDFADDVLTIRGESKGSEEQEGMRYHLRELGNHAYERSFRFPLPINAEAITAEFEHGVLQLYLPKAETAKPRRITVQASA